MRVQRTRTLQTEQSYIERAKLNIQRYSKEFQVTPEANHEQFVSWLINSTGGKSFSNWRQIKASLIFYFKQIQQTRLADKIDNLDHEHTESKSVLHATSSQKKKSVSDIELKEITRFLNGKTDIETSSKWNDPLLTYLHATIAVGLRPCEWAQSELYHHNIEGISLSPPILKVKNAKATNGRSFAEYRFIGLSQLSELQIYMIEFAIRNAQNPKDTQGNEISYKKYMNYVQQRLYYVYKLLYPKKKNRVTLYSCRHQLIANLKRSGYPLEEIACIVGHGNDVTASEHYGRKKFGHESKGKLPMANPEDLSKIRKLFDKKSVNIQREISMKAARER